MNNHAFSYRRRRDTLTGKACSLIIILSPLSPTLSAQESTSVRSLVASHLPGLIRAFGKYQRKGDPTQSPTCRPRANSPQPGLAVWTAVGRADATQRGRSQSGTERYSVVKWVACAPVTRLPPPRDMCARAQLVLALGSERSLTLGGNGKELRCLGAQGCNPSAVQQNPRARVQGLQRKGETKCEGTLRAAD